MAQDTRFWLSQSPFESGRRNEITLNKNRYDYYKTYLCIKRPYAGP